MCRNKSSRNGTKLCEDFLELIKNIGERINVRRPTPCPRGCRARPLPRGPLELHRPQLQLHIFVLRERKIREKDSLCFTIRSRRQALKPLGRADLESVRGSREGNPSPSSSSNLPPSPISRFSPPCVSNCIVGLLDGDGLDEIYHVIKLVLLGFDP